MTLNQPVRIANLPCLNAYAGEVGTVVSTKPGKVQVRFEYPSHTAVLWFLESEVTAI